MTLALSVAALAVSTLACWYTRRAALRARQAALRARQSLTLAKSDGRLPVRFTRTPHNHLVYVPGCSRCDLSREETREVIAAIRTQRRKTQDATGRRYAPGGYVAGPPALTWLDPEECLLNQDLQCIRPSHHPQDDDQ